MNEVKKVHLGRQQFTISVEAHKALRDYLSAIEKQPGVQAEVTKEVEMRMAELLIERGVTGDKVVLQEDVDFLKEQLGEPRDFKDEDSDTADGAKTDQPDADTAKRLYRDPKGAWIAGVASGLAAYMGIDVLFVRIAFVLLTFASGAGIMLYALIWLLAPEAKTSSERLQMQGKAVTVDSIKQIVDRADIAGASERAGRNFGYFVGKTLEVFFRIILLIIGTGFIIAGAATVLWTVASGVYMLIHGGQIGTDIAFPLGSREVWFVVLAFLTAAIVGFFMFMIGLSIVSQKWRMPGWSVAAVLGVFFVSASVGTALGFDTIPHIRERYRAAHHSQSRTLPEFKSVSLEGEDTAFAFKPDNKYYVELSYLGNVDTKPLQTDVENGRLTVNTKDFMKTPLCSGICFYSDHDLKVTIHAPSIDDVHLTGPDNSFTIDDQLNQDKLTIEGHRYSFGTVRLSHMNPTAIELTDDNNASERRMVLSGIHPAAGDESWIRMDENVVNIGQADTFQLKTIAQCDESDALVYLEKMPRETTINGKTVKSRDELQQLRSPDQSNAYNCVVIR
jgi:phage shock protein PspC (stress-responsive transcriptional regulator)